MQVSVYESGDRPLVLTKARKNAPAAANVFADLLAYMDWAHDAMIVVDWDGNMYRPEQMAEDFNKPVMHLVVRATPDGENYCIVKSSLDVDDTFGKDTIERDDLINILDSLKSTLAKEIERWRKGENLSGTRNYSDA